jgi:hypothetical protein
VAKARRWWGVRRRAKAGEGVRGQEVLSP